MTQRGKAATKVGINHGFPSAAKPQAKSELTTDFTDSTDREREMRLDFIRAIRVIRGHPFNEMTQITVQQRFMEPPCRPPPEDRVYHAGEWP